MTKASSSEKSGISYASDSIDRIGPTLRPDGRVVMRQSWRHLLFLHWAVPVAQLRSLLPSTLEIDTYEGTAYVGLVPFTMTGVRPPWSPSIPGFSNFHETNVRTYVQYRGGNPGVWFFSLDAANAMAVVGARTLWRLPYFFARMSLDCGNVDGPVSLADDANVQGQESSTRITYATERLWPKPRPGNCSTVYSPVGPVRTSDPGTLEHFLIERYILYAGDDQRLFSGQVHHCSYPIRSALVHSLDESLTAAAGLKRGDEAPLAHYSPGVDVEVFQLRQVDQ